jgi:MFS family permease
MRAQLRVVLAVARERTLARIELAYLAFNAAEYGTWTAILVYAYAIGGPATAGLAALVQLVPSAVVAPLAANAGDRFRWHRVLLAGYVVLALAFGATAAAMDAGLPMPVVLAFAALASAAVTVIRPVQAVILPAITHSPADLTAAIAVSSLAESLGAFLGPLAAGLLLLGSGSAEVFLAFAAVLVAAALLVARLPAEIDERRLAPASPRRIAAEALGGFEALASERRLLVVVLVLASSAIVVGTLDVLFVAVAVDLLHAGPSWAGFLGAAAGVGAIGGAFAAVTLVGRRRLTPAVAVSGLAYGLPIAVIAPLQSVATAAGLFALSGAGASVNAAAGRTLLQRLVPDAVTARVFGVLEGLMMLGMALGSVAIGLVIQAFGVPLGLVAAGLIVPVVLAAAWRELDLLDHDARLPDPEALALIRGLPIFGPLSARAIERILAGLSSLETSAGRVVIRQGEPGDAFYVIAEGTVEVDVDGRRVGVRGRGEGFGEIALLRDLPRTATVTAATPLRLLVIERDTFLSAVGGHATSHGRAQATVEAELATAAPADLQA